MSCLLAERVSWLNRSAVFGVRSVFARVHTQVAVCLAVVVLFGSGLVPLASATPMKSKFSVTLDVPLRRQWDANFGYCGETSFISAGLSVGQYLSQFDVRALASPGQPQSAQGSQLLVGVNDVTVANKLHLASARFANSGRSNPSAFLTWVKAQVIAKHPVIMGVFVNALLADGLTSPQAGDADYDHIVVVTGVSSMHPLTQPVRWYPDDTVTFSDNGIWTTNQSGASSFSVTEPFATFPNTREQANAKSASVYSLPRGVRDYGISITGVSDASHEALPVSVAASANSEGQSMRDHAVRRPVSTRLTLRVTVSGLVPSRAYKLYSYDSASKVPDRRFNANSTHATKRWKFVAGSSTQTVTVSVRSSDEVFFRAVRASSP